MRVIAGPISTSLLILSHMPRVFTATVNFDGKQTLND